ncbi:MAG: amidase [Haloarculaceae archaeon]
MAHDSGFESATEVAAAVRAGQRSPVDLVDAALERIAEQDDLNAFVSVLEDEARERAREAESAVEAGEDLGPLHGVPIAIKDLFQPKAGVPNTMGLAPLADNVADHTALIVERLEDAGAIVLGTTNTPELGHTMRTYNELVGPTATPFDPDRERNAGGSSGGSAAALAAGLVALATGSDVGGSLRIPASCCGVVSVKPTLGLIPKDTRPDGWNNHTPVGVLGPLARTVDDVALMLSVLVGRDDVDPFSVPAPDVDYTAATDRSVDDLSVGYTPDLDTFAVAQSVRTVCGDAVDDLAAAGPAVERVSVDAPAHSELTYAYGSEATPLFAATAKWLEDEYDLDVTGADREALSNTFVQTVRMGQGHEVVEYLQTSEIQTELYDAVEAVLADHDALAMPVTATPPLEHHEAFPSEIDGERVTSLPMNWGLAWPFNMTGHPVVTVPAGLTDDGLPIGLQLVGSRFDEPTLLALAGALENERPWADAYPGA